MRHLVLASDYDGTLAQHGRVHEHTLEALHRLRASGRRLILVTGRELGDLLRVFAHAKLCDRIVCENGAVLYDPQTDTKRLLCAPPPAAFLQTLQAQRVEPLGTGQVIVATLEANRASVEETIRELGLPLRIILNKGSVMVLPAGVTKATGLAAALGELGFGFDSVVAIGDAENDEDFLVRCAVRVAVANALPALKREVDIVTKEARGAGVSELIERLIATDLSELPARRLAEHP